MFRTSEGNRRELKRLKNVVVTAINVRETYRIVMLGKETHRQIMLGDIRKVLTAIQRRVEVSCTINTVD
jgi:hypothetical protein